MLDDSFKLVRYVTYVGCKCSIITFQIIFVIRYILGLRSMPGSTDTHFVFRLCKSISNIKGMHDIEITGPTVKSTQSQTTNLTTVNRNGENGT